jgi:hypothetical protein
MHTTEIVIGVIDCDHVAVVLKLLREGICQPGAATDTHPQVTIDRLKKKHESVKLEFDAA